jgi:tetratricopeptide (TPR) repeat protein
MESLTIRGFINLGSSHQGKGDLQGAEQSFQDALALSLRTNSSRLAALGHLNLASVYDRLHRPNDQILNAKAALDYFQPNHWVRETFQSILLIGRGEQYRGNFDAALTSFQSLLEESTKSGDRANIAAAEENLGNVLSSQEKLPQALSHYQEFLKASGDSVNAGYAMLDCAVTLARLGRYVEAIPEFAKAELFAEEHPDLLPSIARYRAEMDLSRNQLREVIGRTRKALEEITNLNPRTAANLTWLFGLALVRSGQQKAGLQKCESALADARNLTDPGLLLDTRIALLESLLAIQNLPRAVEVFHDLEDSLKSHPESRWRCLALIAHADRQYLDRAKEAFNQLEALWGSGPFQDYVKRPDVHELSRHLFPANSANH